VRGAFVERILGLGFASFGAGGGGAAVWGAAASGDIDICCAGIETGEGIGRAGDVVPAWPDIIALRVRTVHGTRKDDRQTRKRDIGNQERWWWWWCKRTPGCLRIHPSNHNQAILSTVLVHKILSRFLYIISFQSHETRYIWMGANTYQGILPALRLLAQSTNLQCSASSLLARFYPPR